MKKILLPLLLLIVTVSNAQMKSFAVHFDLDKFNLTTDASTSLDSFITAHAKNIKIKLYGHTDIMAGYEYNDALSLKRTHAVKNYLVAKGFNAADIIEEKGFGKRRPLNRNHGETEMYLNRRVEIMVEGEMDEAEETDTEESVVTTGKSLAEKIADTLTTTGTNIVLKNMNFYGGTHVIIPESLPVLMELVEVMKKNPTLEIAVEGHICCQEGNADGFDIGTRTVNLSENRAREICLYLSKNGIASARLKYKGFGHQQPLTPYPEKTEAERQNNRRVEIKILKK
jgi:outer membrane protein OmpA-like peptidoglycan-associated protein